MRRCVVAVASVLISIGCAATSLAASGAEVKDNLYGTSFVSPEVGWVCGAFGTIAKTSDGGATWELQSSGTLEALFSIDFVNPRLGWAVGRSGTILHTADGGATWQRQNSPSEKHLFSVDFADATYGNAVGDWGVILVTEDGGATWTERSLTEDVILNSVSVIDHKTALVAGEIGSVFKTEDAGSTWQRLTTGIDKTLFGVRCLDAQRCWVVGIDALILGTTDGGQEWQVRNGSVEMRALSQVGFGQAFENPSLYAVGFDGAFGAAVGELGSVFVTRDGGTSWKRLEASKNWALPWFRDLEVLAGQGGAIVGAHGRRIMIVDGRIELEVEGN